ncbi:trypsin-like peptidase domain-containing protein [Streptomyces bungoensis]|uniref:serine protease n=1 Tax=Streptomyces bungoensis TaxID=285568 RepID=UPI0034301178
MTGPDAERLVSLAAGGRRGSGYLLTPELVLTAGHCVGPEGSEVTVRKYARTDGGYELPAERHTFLVRVRGDDELDYALLGSTTADPFRTGRDGRCGDVRWGRLVGEDAVAAQALGFPRSGVRQVGSQRLLEVEDVRGTVLPLTGSRQPARRVHFQVRTGSSPVAEGASLWSGMSGAALFSGDHLVGVITEDRATIEGRLLALPVAGVFGDHGVGEANACLAAASGTAPAEIALDPVWAGGEILKSAYGPLPPRGQWSEADLLESHYAVVPFRGRARQLAALEDWCEQGGGQRVRLLTGGGTVGKSRLARELCRRMAAKGWVTGVVDPLGVRFAGICDLPEKRLLVIDDADAHAGQLDVLLAEAAERPAGHPLRILAVAHRGGPWWQATRRRYEALVDEEDPPPLAPLGEGERADVYGAALAAFTNWYRQDDPAAAGEAGSAPPGDDPADAAPDAGSGVPGLEGPDFGSYLLILIQALVEARTRLGKLPSSANPTARTRADALLDYALDVQRQRWQESAERQRLPHDPVLLERIVAVSSLAVADGATDGERETEAARRLRLVPDLKDDPEWLTRAFARWQHAEFTGDRYMRSLQPLRLAERLGAKVIAAFPELASHLLDVGNGGPGIPERKPDRARQILNVLHVLQLTAGSDMCGAPDPGTAEPSAQRLARDTLEEALRAHASPVIKLIKQVAAEDEDPFARAIGQSLAAALNSTLRAEPAQEVAAQVLDHFDESCPDALLELATAVAEHAVRYYQQDSGAPAGENRGDLAGALRKWSLFLASSGLRIQAHEVAGRAVDTYHALQQLDPSEEHGFRLGEALVNLADRLVDIGRFEDADGCARDAVQRLTALYQHRPTRRHALGLVSGLCTQATAGDHIGRRREALQAATEACELIERLPEAGEGDGQEPEEIRGTRAFALRNLAWQLGASGQADPAVRKAAESVETYRALRRKSPGRWKRDVAEALSVLGVQYAAKEEWDACVARHSEAVGEHYSALEREYREAVRPQHALALGRLAQAHLGRARSRPAQSRPDDLRRALAAVEQARDEYGRMRKEDRWANRVHEAWASCLEAEVLLALGAVDGPHRTAADARRRSRRAEDAARRALFLYDEMDVRAWNLRFARAHAQEVLAQSYSGRGRPRGKVLRAHEQARHAFVRLDAEQPGQAEEQVRDIEDAIRGLKQAGLPVPPRSQGAVTPPGQGRGRHRPKPGLRSRRSAHTRRRHR